MQISEFLDIQTIEADLGASNKPGVIRELVGLLLRADPGLDPNMLIDVLTVEKLQAPALGKA